MMDILRKSRLWLMLAAVAVVFSAIIPATAATATATAATTTATTTTAAPLIWHSGSFVKRLCYNSARSFAQSALKRNGFRVEFNPPNAVVGSNGSTIVEVSYAPATNYNSSNQVDVQFVVTGVSNTSSLAENGRNSVRASIVNQKAIYFDTC
jgi:hypothetical protein